VKCPKGSLPVPHPVELREKARALYESGMTRREIADETGLSLNTVAAWRKRDGWAKPAQALEMIVPAMEPIEMPASLIEKQEVYTDKMSEAAVRLAHHVAALDGEGLIKAADKISKGDLTARRALRLSEDKPYPVIQIAVLAQQTDSKPNLHSVKQVGSQLE
jgi:hypothetical protein